MTRSRRDVLRALGVTAAGLVLSTACDLPLGRAMAPKVPTIGYVFNGGPEDIGPGQLEGLRDGLRESGLVERQNLRIEWRWGMGRNERLPELIADLLRLDVQLLITPGGTAVRAARAATDRVPIVLVGGGDPVAIGVAGSLARPGGNVTGISQRAVEGTLKTIEMLTAIRPGARRMAYMGNMAISPPSTVGRSWPRLSVTTSIS